MQLKKNTSLIVFLFFIFTNFLFAEEIGGSTTKQLSSQASLGDEQSGSSTTSLPDKIIAGFLDIRTPSSMKRVDMKQVKKDGYNVIVLAFGEVHGANIDFYSSNRSSKSLEHAVVNKIKQAKKMHMEVLIAVGGVPNTFHPGIKKDQSNPVVLGKKVSNKQINELANSIVAFLNKYNIDGIVYSFKKHTSPNFIDKLSTKLKKIDPSIIISIAPSVKDYKLVTTGRSNDYDKTIRDGNIDYIMLLEFNTYPEYDPNFIFDSYEKIIKNTKIPLKTKISIVEPTTAVAGGVDTIYHSQGDATTSLTTQQAVKLMLPQLEKLKFKPRFVGVAGWSLNIDYAADLYDSHKHVPGTFAKDLRDCIYKNICNSMQNKIQGPVVAGFLPLWGKNSSYNIFGKQVTSKPIDIQIPKEKEYCDQYPGVCKNNVIIAVYLTYSNSQGFRLSFNQENGSSKKTYSPEQLKAFVKYMTAKGKHVLISYGGETSHIDWKTINFDGVKKIVQDYGFNGINFNLVGTEIPGNQKTAALAAKKIKELCNSLKQKIPNFWLTFSPKWHYIVAPVAKNNKDSIFVNHGYIDLLKDIGINNINYIFLNTYAEKVVDGIFSFDKGKDGNYLKITPLEGYDKFLASLAWSLTTDEGYNANLPKYSRANESIHIPANKLVFMIPATKGSVHGGMTYVLAKQDIDRIITLIEKHKASFAGFAIWSMDFDSMYIAKGQLTGNYTHKPWSITNAIANIKLPEVHQTTAKKKNVAKAFSLNNEQQKLDVGIINYPKNIGVYSENTVVSYQGKKYKCISKLDVKLCNDKRYIPNGFLGHAVWYKLNNSKKRQVTRGKIN